MRLHPGWAVLFTAQAFVGLAASPAIGVATGRGDIRVDQASISGSGTLFEGTTIETLRSAGDVRMANGVRLQLASGSKGQVYRDRFVLERGESRLTAGGSDPFDFEAASLRISGHGPEDLARVRLDPENQVLVAAERGSLSVSTSSGIPLASIAAGHALAFNTQGAGPRGPTELTGNVLENGGRYFLTDEAAGITVELRGTGIAGLAGSRVQVTGALVPVEAGGAGPFRVVQVASVKVLEGDSDAIAAAAVASAAGAAQTGAGAGGGSAAGAAAGVTVATKAIVAGVIVAGATAGTVVAVAGPDEPPPISR